MGPEFNPILLDDQQLYKTFLSQCPQVTSDYSFVNVWNWASAYDLVFTRADEFIWLQQNRPSPQYWAPVGNWEAVDWLRYFERFPQFKSTIIRVPEPLARLWASVFGDRITVSPDRDQFDYLYDAEELAQLPGNRFHKKRNLLNQFLKNYDYRYVEMSPAFVEAAMAMQDSWCTWRECDSAEQLAHENQAIAKVLSHWEELDGIIGGCLLVDDVMVAYTIGEPVGAETLVIHFEKGNTDYKGVYQAINQMFVQRGISAASNGIRWINREQDLGDAGLRKAKASYQPVEFLQKYRVEFSE